jgi:hypothetical protein
MFAAGTETMQFLSSRMQHDIEVQRALVACKTFDDIHKVQADFYTKALEDYRLVAAKMMEIMSAGASDAATAAASSTKRGYDDVPL